MALQLDKMSNQQFDKAFDRFNRALEMAEKDAANSKKRLPSREVLAFLKKHEIPYKTDDAWDTLLAKLQNVREEYEQEQARRCNDYSHPAKTPEILTTKDQ